MFMDNFLTSSNYFNMEDFQAIPTTYFWETMWTEENNQSNASAFY